MNLDARLTPREDEVTELLGLGWSKKEVAYRLGISVYTVNALVRNIYDKVGVNKCTELCLFNCVRRFGISLRLLGRWGSLAVIFLLLVLIFV